VLTLLPKTSKTADMEKKEGDIPMAQIYDEVIVNNANRLQLKFEDCFSTVTYQLKSIFTREVFLLEFSKVLKYKYFFVKY
jgi:hypothetical protein